MASSQPAQADVSLGRPRSRTDLIRAVRRDLATARGAVRATQAAAGAAATEARAHLATMEAAAPERIAHLEAVRDSARMEIFERHRRESAGLSTRIEALAASCAPGAAGAPWRTWRPAEPEGGRPPALLRIGTVESLPALVPLLDKAHLTISGTTVSTMDGLISGLLLRALGSTPPGSVELTVYDPELLGGSLAGFAPLGNAGLLTFVGPGGLTAMLDELVEEIRRINESVLAGEYASLSELDAATPGRRPEPWRLAVLLGEPAFDLSSHQRAQLDRIVRTGVACGVHVIARGVPIDPDTVRIDADRGWCSYTGDLKVRLDPPPPADRVTAVCKELAERVLAGPPPLMFADLIPERFWTESSAADLVAPLGEGPAGRLVEVVLGDDPPHALIGGPSGSGKTNLIYAWLAALCARYSPDELALYLLDFKEGVSFARFAPGRRDPSWLPHVRLVGVNINGDREFGLALLRHLGEELRRRAQAAKRHEATKLAELRAEDPGGRWPRIVAVIDEFQVLLAGRDSLATEAVTLLEDLARRGRSQGIHLVLASQDVSGIEALWGRSALVAQFTLRIALPKARRILADTNLAADLIPRFHAVVNADSGVPDANQVVRLPDASDRQTWQSFQQVLSRARPPHLSLPRLFDGDTVPVFPPLPTDQGQRGVSGSPNHSPMPLIDEAVLGEMIDVEGRAAVMRFGRAPGRNLAVLGTRVEDACAILGAAALSLAVHGGRFSVLCLDEDAAPSARALCAAIPDAAWFDNASAVLPLLKDGPHYVIGYAWDAAVLSAKERDEFRAVLGRGPERRVHVLGWWRSVARLRDDLGGLGTRSDAIGAWVALDVHGGELAPFSAQPGGPAWHPRPHRALFFDRAVHRVPQVILPYQLPKPEDER